MAVALLALFVALGGGAYAAVTVSGKNVKNNSLTGKDVKQRSLTGKDVRNNSIAGRQVKESKLGTVPSAGSAGVAGGLSPAADASYFKSSKVVTSGVVKLPAVGNSPATSPARTILAKGPFSVRVQCYGSVDGPVIRVVYASSEPNSILDGEPGTSKADTFFLSAMQDPTDFDGFTRYASLLAPSGATLAFTLEMYLNAMGSPCVTGVNSLSQP